MVIFKPSIANSMNPTYNRYILSISLYYIFSTSS